MRDVRGGTTTSTAQDFRRAGGALAFWHFEN